MAVDVNTTLKNALAQLRRERQDLDTKIEAIEKLIARPGRRPNRRQPQNSNRRTRPKISAGARKKMSIAAKKRWAKMKKGSQ